MNIGELAKQSGLAASRIRFYEAEGLISQVGRQAKGYRRYAPEALQTLQLIQSAQQAGFTLQELKALMPAPGEHKREELIEALERKVQQIEGMQAQLAHSKTQLLGVIEAVRAQFPPIAVPLAPRREVLATLPEKLRGAQAAFAATGGLHASALFAADGTRHLVREDVGRHNALDKVVGHAFFAERLPLTGHILLVSGRVSFEIMQKALAAGLPCVAAISAPTSAAVEFARASGQTLVGFLRGERMNVYAGTLAG